MRVGIFGGTFDPPHIGHLILAEEAWFQLKLDAVIIVPAGDPPHKRNRRLSAAASRVRMVKAAIVGNDHFVLSRVDVDRPGPHYTIDMVRLLRDSLPAGSELFFLMGSDSLRDLPNWHLADRLVANCRLVALARHDVTLDWEYLEGALPGLHARVIQLDMPELEIASHILQERIRTGQPIRYQVPEAVEAIIAAEGLYREAAE
ncbi:nicotinate-nucleotide adenylyltransferase [Candidatus Amarolinea dominans]|uniref:nicotinate-nucleotide adenylyltransferase n=1 Tax=Candidatus Amarolinea dominans TaxID=3140696 RepID=UPI003137652D|nr:nicotinate (nicotinamide) nucleotide adenylyltransferase [Anaerolineae bacterium]MBK9092154.1 nicotinate (nicotinamide) nucleotide adenylyltransferase [Anaerolineae bacterium]